MSLIFDSNRQFMKGKFCPFHVFVSQAGCPTAKSQSKSDYSIKNFVHDFYHFGRALAVPQIFGTRSFPRSLLKKGTRSVLRSNFEKRNAFRSSFLRKGTVVPFPFLNKKIPKTYYQILLLNRYIQIYLKLYTIFAGSKSRIKLREN